MMFDIGQWLYDLFGPYGGWGVLLALFLIFYIDAVLFPTLPELFFTIGIMYESTWQWAILVLVVVSIAEALGLCTLYYIVEYVKVPERIKNIADKYSKFLIVHDEKMLLVNRVAPMLPFAGAFVSLIPSWTLKRALVYNFIGCYVKYGIIILFAGFFQSYFSGPEAQWVTIVFVIILMAICLIIAFIKKRREGLVEDS